MCSTTGVSVWFACKLCKSFFLNVDDFAYHKKKSHLQQFQSTKFIVFEEQTTPTASPPENWVSFLSPKEETQIHKIISFPSSTTTTNLDCKPLIENAQRHRNEEFFEIDLENNTFNDQDGHSPGSANKVFNLSNNDLELNCVFSSNNDDEDDDDDKALNVTKNYPLQDSFARITSTDYNLEHEKQDKHWLTLIEPGLKLKSNCSNIRKEKIENISSNPLQTVIQSLHNPYVHLKRLKSISFADVNEVSRKTLVESEMCLTNEDQSSATNLPLFENLDDFCIADCKTDFDHDAVSTNDNDAWEENVGETPSISKNIPRDPLSSLESILPDLATSQTTSNSVCFKCRFCSKKIKSGAFPTHVKVCQNLYSNQNQPSNLFTNQNPVLKPNTEINFSYGDLLDLVVKTEHAEGTEDSEFTVADTDTDPLKCESNVELLANNKERHDVAATSPNTLLHSSHEKHAPQSDLYRRHCVSCKKQFVSIKELKFHHRNHHGTHDGKPNFQCPHSNCEKTTTTNADLKKHITHAHSLARPFRCLHPNCAKSFKSKSNINRHLRQVHSS